MKTRVEDAQGLPDMEEFGFWHHFFARVSAFYSVSKAGNAPTHAWKTA
jgi:hypothetical protein